MVVYGCIWDNTHEFAQNSGTSGLCCCNEAMIHGYNFNGHFRNLNWRYLPYIRPISGLCKGISPQNVALYGTVPPF